ncbi:MAG TPA: hypothetical protein VHC47_05530, partial [Mucilaginibacter sp.]|nr:hypothetical protein [Mucilaginibacter sp.]
MKFRYAFAAVILLLFCTSLKSFSQEIKVDEKPRNAYWITVPGEAKDYEVCLFRKTIDLPGKPSSYKVHVSGDNRYKLFVNDSLVSIGPARGDLYYWNYETVDLAPYLTAGKNVISAIVF